MTTTRKETTRKENNKRIERKVRNIEPTRKSATDKAREAAAREEAREARKAEREHQLALAKKFDEITMSVNDALRAVASHANDTLEDGLSVGEYMAQNGLKKLDIKSLRKALPSAFVREDGIYMPTTLAAVYDGAPEDDRNGKAIYYVVVKGKGAKAHKVWKKAQTYGFERIELWTPRVVRRLLSVGMTYASKTDGYAKRNAEVKNCKQFYVLNERKENAISNKTTNRKSVIEDYVAVDKENVKFAE